jgi:hypothetical protein
MPLSVTTESLIQVQQRIQMMNPPTSKRWMDASKELNRLVWIKNNGQVFDLAERSRENHTRNFRRGVYMKSTPFPKMNRVEKLAHRFALQLIMAIGMSKVKQVVKLNDNESDPHVCHSHDFCDANMCMLEAMKLEGICTEDSFHHPKHGKLFFDAWTLAKQSKFYIA